MAIIQFYSNCCYFITIIVKKDGEDVEFKVKVNEQRGGKKFATQVTGPNGGNVQGTVRAQQGGCYCCQLFIVFVVKILIGLIVYLK